MKTFACFFNVILKRKETRVYHKSDENSLKDPCADPWSILFGHLATKKFHFSMCTCFQTDIDRKWTHFYLFKNFHDYILMANWQCWYVFIIVVNNGEFYARSFYNILVEVICFFHLNFWLLTYLNNFPIFGKIPIG